MQQHQAACRHGTPACPANHARPRRTRCSRGLTLVELLVCLAVLATLVASGTPAYAGWIANARLAAFAEQLAYSLSLARAEAVKHGGRINLCKVAGAGASCTTAGGWERGWMMFPDDNGNAKADAAEPIVRVEPAAQYGITARGNQPIASYVSFTAFGQARLASGGLQMGTITVCKTGLKGWHVVLASTGRVRMERATSVCP